MILPSKKTFRMAFPWGAPCAFFLTSTSQASHEGRSGIDSPRPVAGIFWGRFFAPAVKEQVFDNLSLWYEFWLHSYWQYGPYIETYRNI